MLSVQIQKRLGKFHLNAEFEASSGITGLLGASGCGKSMTLRCIAGIEKPDKGRIVLDGETLFDSEKGVNLPPQKRKVGYLFQNYALFPNMTVKNNILCGLYHEKKRTKKQHAFTDILKLLKLEGLENHRPAQLSGGQQQRVALARILVSAPGLLMLDEPFSALDSHLRGQLQIQMKKLLAEYGRTVLMVTHNRTEAYNLCGNIAIMDKGTLLTQKDTKKLFADPETIAGAMITGCKNIIAAKKTGEYEVEVPEWGIRFRAAQVVKDHICAIGIRAHYFGVKSEQNRYAISITDELEEPFEYVIRFRYAAQDHDSEDIWWRLPKDRKLQQTPSELGVSPSNIILLYPEIKDATQYSQLNSKC